MLPWRRLASLVLGLAVFAPASGSAAPPAVGAYEQAYDIYVGGIWVGEVTAESLLDEGAYLAEASFRTAGIVSFFVDERWRGLTEGRIVENELVPIRYLSRQLRAEGDRLREVTFENGDPVAVSADPPTEKRPWSIDVADQSPAVDPATAVVELLAPASGATMCGRRIDIYDGKHHFAFDIGAPERDGDRIVCEGAHIRVAGYKPKKLDDRRDFKLYLEQRDGLWQVTRVTTKTPLGTAVMRPRD